MTKLLLELYVVGQSPRSLTAIHNLRRICGTLLEGRCQLEIIDVLEQPQAAEDQNIVATPTLIRRSPPPVRRLVGDLSETGVVLKGLDIESETADEGGQADD